MTEIALAISILVSASAVAAAYAVEGLLIPAAVILAVGLPWLLRGRSSSVWIAWLTAGVLAMASACGAALGANAWLLVIGLVGALSAWDLDAFARQLWSVDEVVQELERRHLARLLIVAALSLVLTGLALTVQLQLSFGVALALGLVALVGLSRAIGMLGRGAGS